MSYKGVSEAFQGLSRELQGDFSRISKRFMGILGGLKRTSIHSRLITLVVR